MNKEEKRLLAYLDKVLEEYRELKKANESDQLYSECHEYKYKDGVCENCGFID